MPTQVSRPGGRAAGMSPAQVVRAAYRKLIHRRVEMRRYGMRAGDSRAPARPELTLRIELLGPDRFDAVLPTNPHMVDSDREHFHRQRTTCIVAFDGDRVASSTWMTSGDVFAHELQRTVHVPPDEHLSCRSYVDPDYRGLALMSHMIHAYSERQDPDDEVWGFVYGWNTESVRSLERIGWRWSGDYWTSFVLGRAFPGERRFPPRSPETLG